MIRTITTTSSYYYYYYCYYQAGEGLRGVAASGATGRRSRWGRSPKNSNWDIWDQKLELKNLSSMRVSNRIFPPSERHGA